MREVLDYIMKGLNLSTSELANKLDINTSTIRYWKRKINPRKPSATLFNSLCEQIKENWETDLKKDDKNIVKEAYKSLVEIVQKEEELSKSF